MNKVIGIDFGNTIVHNVKGKGLKKAFPDALRVIRLLAQNYPVHIISKVNAEQEIHVKKWMQDNLFFYHTGILGTNVHFCAERWQKSLLCKKYKITHHIDDRPEVIIHLDPKIQSYLFRPIPSDVVRYFSSLKAFPVLIVQDWKMLEIILL